MKNVLTIGAALAFSALAGTLVASKAMPVTTINAVFEELQDPPSVENASSRGGGDRDRDDRPSERRPPADCHRDVRTHRIDGVMVRHRHVGQNCAVREVRTGTDRSPGQ